jgi:hypothetical protein
MNRLFKTLRIIIICAAAAISIAGMVYYFKLMEIIFAMLALEVGKKELVTISRKNLFFIMRKSGNLSAVIGEMENLGWTFTNRYGRGLIFSRHGEEIVLIEKSVVGRYKIYVLESIFRDKDEIKGF